jgi:hypothetical protein
MRGELKELAEAWADGGGTFGYPFWEKAGHRMQTGEITPTMYREYVTGYRDRLVLGCGLIEHVDTSSDTTEQVRGLVLDACEARVDGLRQQQHWLDELIDATTATDEDEAADHRTKASEHQAEALTKLEDSWRDTRMAMDAAQSALDAAGLERLHEDAFL